MICGGYVSNILDIYNTLIRIERNNHIAKRKNIYSKEQISRYYRLKAIELFNVIKRIDDTKPKCISYIVKEEIYRNIDCYLFIFNVLENKKYHLPNRIFQFHQPKYLFKGEKICNIRAISTLKS